MKFFKIVGNAWVEIPEPKTLNRWVKLYDDNLNFIGVGIY